MTGARKVDAPATLSVEFGCDRHCEVEFDLSEMHIRFTLGQMLGAAEFAHDEAHTVEQRIFRCDEHRLVRATVQPWLVTR